MAKPNWKLRRVTVKLTLSWVTVMCGYLLYRGNGESMLHETLVSNLLLLAFLVVGGYVFGVASDNHVNGSGEEDTSGSGKDTALGTWSERRKVILRALVLCAGALTYLMLYGEDSTLNSTFASGLCLFYAGVINSWIFGGVYDDYAIKQKLNKE